MSRSIRVLHSLAPPDGTTRYVDQMTQGAPADVEVSYFSWRRALRGDYDVLHVHWPELLLRGRTRRKRFAKRLAMRATLAATSLRGIPIVRTVHNVQPHERGRAAENRVLRALDRHTDLFIALNPTTPLAPGARGVTILHGHYRDRFAAHPRREREPGRVVYFGIIRPYKNVPALIDVFTSRPRDGEHLRIVGSPSDDVRRTVEESVARHDAVSARLAFVADDELVAEVTAAQLVVLPYAEMHNSGAALVALSLNRPVLVPRSPASEALADEAGGDWVLMYDGALDDASLTAALAHAAGLDPDAAPRLEGRDWDEVGRRHRDAYRTALARKKGPRA